MPQGWLYAAAPGPSQQGGGHHGLTARGAGHRPPVGAGPGRGKQQRAPRRSGRRLHRRDGSRNDGAAHHRLQQCLGPVPAVDARRATANSSNTSCSSRSSGHGPPRPGVPATGPADKPVQRGCAARGGAARCPGGHPRQAVQRPPPTVPPCCSSTGKKPTGAAGRAADEEVPEQHAHAASAGSTASPPAAARPREKPPLHLRVITPARTWFAARFSPGRASRPQAAGLEGFDDRVRA